MSTRTTKNLGTLGISSAQVGEFWVSFQFDVLISSGKRKFITDFESAASTNSATLAIAGKCPENAQKPNDISEICKSYIRRAKCSEVQLNAASSAEVGEFWVTFFRCLKISFCIFLHFRC
jgi:hypothetical protein